jgi:hypothetical protein
MSYYQAERSSSYIHKQATKEVEEEEEKEVAPFVFRFLHIYFLG